MSVDGLINEYFQPISEKLAGIVFYSIPVGEENKVILVLVWLVIAALFFTVYLGFINVRYFKHAIDLVRGKYDTGDGLGQISRFQALMTSLSGTVGLGNIAGVAVAVSLGGPGAVFWMVLMGLFGMSTKFVEVTCGVKYRHHPDPEHPEKISGGPMYYLRDGFANRNMPFIGKFMAVFFAVCFVPGVLGGGSLFQTNQVFQQVINITGGPDSFMIGKGWMFGLFMAFIVGLVIIGGIRSIAAVTSKVVPFMGGLYLVAGLIVIGVHYQAVPQALLDIVSMAFSPKAGLGGLIGVLLVGVQRASFSNEAGFGSAAIAHSAVKTDQPVSQGFVGMLGPFIDTIIICTITGLVIVVSGVYEITNGMEGIELTSRAFASGISWFPYVLFFIVFLFAYSTLISWSYYGVKAFTYLFGTSIFTEITFKAIFCIFIVIGASADLHSVILFTDSMVFAMAVPNVIGLYLLAPEIKRDIKKYIEGIKIRDAQNDKIKVTSLE